MKKARLIIDEPANGAWNMSVDQALLQTADTSGLVTLRFYRWSKPTLSLGYFQKHKDRNLHAPSLNCDLVRRKTGGGAILHDHELTYSLSVPSANRWSSKNTDLYQLVHNKIIQVFHEYDVKTQLYSELMKNRNNRSDIGISPASFMCFNRRSDGDIILDGHKIVGSAQRRNKTCLLQHGSILIRKSLCAPAIEGIEDLAGQKIEMLELARKLANGMLIALSCEYDPGTLDEFEKQTAQDIYSIQFNTDRWNQNR